MATSTQAPQQPGLINQPAARDALFLAFAVACSFALYAPKLWFYSDDWAFFGAYATTPDQSVSGLYHASMSPQHAMRPIQVWLCAWLFRLFGMNALGYHLFNGGLLIANAVLLYLVLQELRAARPLVLGTSLVYALLPNYSTDRVWFLSFAVTLSMTACLASIFSDLRAVVAPPRRCVAWKVISVAALLVSGLSYEVALPLFGLTPLLLCWRAWIERPPAYVAALRRPAVLTAVTAAILIAIIAFKLRVTIRLGAEQGVRAQILEIVHLAIRRHLPYGHYGLNVFSALYVHFVEYGLKLPLAAASFAGTGALSMLWLTGAFAAACLSYLLTVFRRERWPSPSVWAALIAIGFVVFGLGYAIFLTNFNVQFTATGIANRSAIAAALGAAFVLVGVVGIFAACVPVRMAAPVAAAGITALASCGFLIDNGIAERWVAAARIEREVLDTIRSRYPSLPPASTLILDGVCPYVGPAVVFESYWDLAGALLTFYRDPAIQADVATPRLTVGDDGISTTIYNERQIYPYSAHLLVYNRVTGETHPLPDAATARAYFAASTTRFACPEAHEGVGVRIKW